MVPRRLGREGGPVGAGAGAGGGVVVLSQSDAGGGRQRVVLAGGPAVARLVLEHAVPGLGFVLHGLCRSVGLGMGLEPLGLRHSAPPCRLLVAKV